MIKPSASHVACAVALAALAACSSSDPARPTLGAPGSPSSDVPPSSPAPPDAGAGDAGDSFPWNLPAGFPKPKVPADNPMSIDKVELGRRLFYDRRLSGNQTQSCASCHDPSRSFTDGLAQSVGATGELHPRGSIGLANVGYVSALTWANSLILDLEQQALIPMFADSPIELGLSSPEQLLSRLRADATYADLFRRSFPTEAEPLTLQNVTKAIAAFERTLISGRSRYDRYLAGDPTALTESEKRGRAMFFSEELECYHCHGGFAFSDSIVSSESRFYEASFHNTGLYNLDGNGAYPDGNRGLLDVTGKPQDMGRFRAPSLRNVAVTAPYFHDGSAATLSDVLDHYAAGGRLLTSGPFAGSDGSTSPLKSDLIRGFTLTPEGKADVIAFLDSLTDEAFLTNDSHAAPSPEDSP